MFALLLFLNKIPLIIRRRVFLAWILKAVYTYGGSRVRDISHYR